MYIDYRNIKINGMCYVREIKSKNGERGFYLLINNFNKPEIDVYDFLRERMRRYGDALNSIKRKVHDLCHLYDFMNIINITPELLTYNELYEFCDGYLRKINPKFRVDDPIERSMLRKIPILEEYGNGNVDILDRNQTRGLNEESIARILNTAKLYLIFLKGIKEKDIDLDKLFTIKEITVNNDDQLLGHLNNSKKAVYSVSGILKAAEIFNVNRHGCRPIDGSCLFEKEEEEMLFVKFSNDKNPMIKALFYLLRKTGMRINEALALQVELYKITEGDGFLTDIKSDLRLINKNENLWQVDIVYRPGNPKDLQLKNRKSRSVQFIDTDQVFLNLYRQAILYRNITIRAKKKNHRFLFINRSGDRLKYPRTHQIFSKALEESELICRKGDITIHSYRHTYASDWVRNMKRNNADIELNELSRILGHSNSKTTREIYVHFFKDDTLELLKKMENTKYQR